MAGANGHRGARVPVTAPVPPTVHVVDGGELYRQVAGMAATLVRIDTQLAAHLEAQREERAARREEREADEGRMAALERKVWAIPGAGTLIALGGIVLTVMAMRGG